MAIVSLWWIAYEGPELRFQFFTSPHAVFNFHSLHVRILTDKHLLCSSDKKKQICFIHWHCTEMPRLSDNQRNQAIGMLQAGAMVNEVAQHFGCSHQTSHNLYTRFAITGSIRDRPHPGQCHVTSQQDDRYITLTHLRNQFLPTMATARQLGINAQIIWNCLRQNNIAIRARRPYTDPILTARYRAARLLWAQRRLHWTHRQWHNVIFSDELWFSISHADCRVRVYRGRNERYAQCCIRERDRFRGGSVMVVEVSWAMSRQILWLYRVISMLNAMLTSWIITSFHSCRILDLA